MSTNTLSDQNSTCPIITVDGSSGAGKGTLTTRLANQLGYQMLDSGALYRIVGLFAHQAQLLGDDINEAALATLTEQLDIQFSPAKAGSS